VLCGVCHWKDGALLLYFTALLGCVVEETTGALTLGGRIISGASPDMPSCIWGCCESFDRVVVKGSAYVKTSSADIKPSELESVVLEFRPLAT
jgi:hypothetical protein